MKLDDAWLEEMKKRGLSVNDPRDRVGSRGKLSSPVLDPEPETVVKPRHRRGIPNATEQEWGDRLVAEGITSPHFEAVALRLAPGAKYTPDWFYVGANGPCFDEVKGGLVREASIVRLKVAASLFPEFRFRICRKMHGSWNVEEVPSGRVP